MYDQKEGDKMDIERHLSTVKELVDFPSSRKLVLNALKEVMPDRIVDISFLASAVIGISLGCKIGFSNQTADIMTDISTGILSVTLALFGILFTVYSLLLAFLNDSYIEKLSAVNYDGRGKSYLKQALVYFESILFLYWIGLGMSGGLVLCLKWLRVDDAVWASLRADWLPPIILSVYFTFIIRLIFELKSTIYNTIVLFRSRIAYQLIEITKTKEEEQNVDNPE